VVDLAAHESLRLDGVASLYETNAVGGPPDQPAYLNSAIRLYTTLEPVELLELLLSTETLLGRTRREPLGPRTIDLDLLLFGEVTMNRPELTVPHPRLDQRGFVLAPLAEIAGEVVHPMRHITIRDLYARWLTGNPDGKVVRIAGPQWVEDPGILGSPGR